MTMVRPEGIPMPGVYFPVELLGDPSIHEYVPHLPVIRREGSGGNPDYFTIPMGDDESRIDGRIALFAQKAGEGAFSLVLDRQDEEKFPISMNHGRLLRAPIGEFLVLEKKWLRPVFAFDTEGEEISFGKWQSQNLKGFLMSAVRKAVEKSNGYYSSQP